MSSHQTPNIYTYKSEAALSGKRYHLAKFGAKDNTVVLSALDDKAIGIIMTETSNEVGQELEIAGPNGGGVVKVAAAIARGEFFKSDANGKAVVTLDRATALGRIDESATAADQCVACVLF